MVRPARRSARSSAPLLVLAFLWLTGTLAAADDDAPCRASAEISPSTAWAGQLSVRFGLTVRDGERSARLSGVYHQGPSPMGQFFLTDERYWGIELILEP